MFDSASFISMIAVSDVDKGMKFWVDKLGFKPTGGVGPDGSQKLQAPGTGSPVICLYPSTFAGTAQSTVAGFEAPDFDGVISGLRDAGIKFEDYDMPELKTVDGVASMGDMKAAWFKDPDGNIIAITTPVAAMV